MCLINEIDDFLAAESLCTLIKIYYSRFCNIIDHRQIF